MPSLLPNLLVAMVLAPAVAGAQITRPTRTPMPVVEQPPPGQPTTTRVFRAIEPVAGAAPQGIGVDAQGTYGIIAKVIWQPAPNAASYVVTRRLAQDPACCNASSGPITGTSWTDTGLLRKGTYMYTVQVNYADGSVGSGEFGIGADGVRNPALTAADLSPGRVRLTFDNNIPGTSGFLVGGPGMGNQGKTVSSGPVDTPILPPGTYTWTIASIYSGGLGIQSHYTEWSTVTHRVSYGAGRYRISLERFKAVNPTRDDMLQRDGKGDEVYLTAFVGEYERNGGLASSRMVRTPTFGDVNGFSSRVRAGSASSLGGIVAGDQYPAPVDLVADLKTPTTNDLPFLVWEGDLTQLDGEVIVSPAIWESDGDDRLVPPFQSFQTATAPSVPYRNAFVSYMPNSYGRAMLDTWHPQRSCLGTPGQDPNKPPAIFVAPFGAGDQPIDINRDNSYCPVYVAINYDVARSLTSTNRAAVVEVPLHNPDSNYRYIVYVRVEKVN